MVVMVNTQLALAAKGVMVYKQLQELPLRARDRLDSNKHSNKNSARNSYEARACVPMGAWGCKNKGLGHDSKSVAFFQDLAVYSWMLLNEVRIRGQEGLLLESVLRQVLFGLEEEALYGQILKGELLLVLKTHI